MKKFISILLLLAMALSLFAGCAQEEAKKEPETTAAANNLPNAVAYLKNMYQTAGKDEIMVLATDKDVLAKVVVDGVSYNVEWTVKVTSGKEDAVTVTESAKENHVKLDVADGLTEEILLTVTATVKDEAGNSESVSFDYQIPALNGGKTPEEMVDAAYALEDGQSLEQVATLTGVITMVNTPYDPGYKNLTVTMQIGELADKLIQCYRLSGDGAEDLAMGDTITVTGTLTNYKGKIQFAQGCVVTAIVKSDLPTPEAPEDPVEIVNAAYALEAGASLPYSATLTGVITQIDTPYDAGYGNISVTIQIGDLADKPILCYRLKGEGAETLAVGDTITATGFIINYNGLVEFSAGCTLDAVVKGEGEAPVAPSDPKQIVADAYALEEGGVLPYSASLTGKITAVDTPWSDEYKNITVTITVEGCDKQPIQCFRLKGDGAEALQVGDTITVTGSIVNYQGKVQFNSGCMVSDIVKGEGNTQTPDTPENPGTTEKPENPGTSVPTDPKQIVDAAYALGENKSLGYKSTLTGKVSEILDAYDSEFKNISVVIKVSGRESKPIICFRMKGDGADKVAVGDTITVTGTLKNYYGDIEFDAGCTLDKRTSGGGKPVVKETDPKKIVDAAYKLSKDTQLAYDATLTGKVTKIDNAYDKDYKNITVTIQVEGRESKPIVCFRLKGDGADKIAVGDTITVTGRLKNYGGTVEFDAGCKLDKRVSGGGTAIKQETDPKKIMEIASKLKENEEMSYDVTLTGKVTSVDDAYDKEFKNITVTITITDAGNKAVKCYRLKGDGVEKIAVKDTITVKGRLKNFYGEIEFTNCTMTKRVSGGGTVEKVETDPLKIIDAAYALGANASLSYDATLTGTVTSINAAYDAAYGNVSVVIEVKGRESKPILCYRMKGNGAEKVMVGDTITVTGRLKNYVPEGKDQGTVEFDAGCTLDKRVAGNTKVETDPKKIVDAAFALEPGKSLPYTATLTGKILEITDKYSTQYKNITVIIEVEGTDGVKQLKCFRMKGDGADKLAVGDTIKVTGIIKNYKHSSGDCEIEFDAGCTFVKA